MGAHQSKEELLYEQVNYGNIEGIRHLRRGGAGLEWMDKEGKTPLILASLRPDLLHVAELLIELGANVNAYRPGCHAGTPLHHAAKKGLVPTVNLLLGHGANPLVMNDDCQTAVDMARANGRSNVVRAIESHICLFSGWLREVHGPSILETIARQWVSRKIWAVVLPCGKHHPTMLPKYELAIYPELKAAQPHSVIPLWKAVIEEPIFNQPDPAIIIVEKAAKRRFKSEFEGDKQQLQRFFNICSGRSQNNSYPPATPAGMPIPIPMAYASQPNNYISPMRAGMPGPMAYSSQPNSHASSAPVGPPQPASEDVELAMAITASIQSAIAEGVPLPDSQPITGTNDFNGWGSSSEKATQNGWGLPDGAAPSKENTQSRLNDPAPDVCNGWAVPEASSSEARPSGSTSQPHANQLDAPIVIPSAHQVPPTVSVPSAPPITEETFYEGPIHYPSIDSTPIDLTVPVLETKPGTSEAKEGGGIMGSCIICLDAPVEAACIPCGHMVGCMSCLKEIKDKKWGCPVCRGKIEQVLKLYAV